MRYSAALSLLLLLPFHTSAQWTYGWAAQTFSPNVEQANNCAVSHDGHVALVGMFQQDIQMGSFTNDGSPGNGLHGFVAQYDVAGTFEWAHAFSGWHQSGADTEPRDVAIDAGGNVIVAGSFNDSLLMDGVKVLDRPDTVLTGAHLFYVLKFTAGGTLTWAKAIGVEGYTGSLNAVAVDGNGDIYTVGAGGNDRGWFHKLSGTDGHILFALSPPAVGAVIHDVTTDGANNVYIDGQCTNTFTMGGMTCPYNNELGSGSTPLFIGKFTSAGQALWYYVPDQTGSGYYGFPEGNIAATPDGQCFVETRKMVRILGDTIADGNGAIHGLFSLDADGQPLWARKLNVPNGQISISDVHCDNEGNVLLAGKTYGPTLDLLDTVINSSFAGFNVFLGRYDRSSGALTGLLNGPALQDVMGVGVDDADVPTICGTAAGPVQLGGNSITGSWNAFVTRLASNVGIHEQDGRAALRAWPNPTDGPATLQLPMSAAWTVTITDALGRMVREERVTGSWLSLDLSAQRGGVYRVSAASGAVRVQSVVVVK